MIKGITDLLDDLASELKANKIDEATIVCNQILDRKLSLDDLKEMVRFLENNYQLRFMPLLIAKNIDYSFDPDLRFNFLTTILIKCASKSLGQEVNTLLGLKDVNINLLGCLIALQKSLEKENSAARNEVIKSLLGFNNGQMLWITRTGHYKMASKQKEQLEKLRGTVLVELAKAGDHDCIRDLRIFREDIKHIYIQCALGEACIKGHYSVVKVILDCYLVGKNQGLVFDLESQIDPDRVEQALTFARDAMKYSKKHENITIYLKELIVRVNDIIERKAQAEVEQQNQLVALQKAQEEIASLTANFSVGLRFSIPDDDEPIERPNSEPAKQAPIKKPDSETAEEDLKEKRMNKRK